eukprot:m.25953 g.25953  ORF g.25953 m.25953 type:complete len:526 (+) comp8891_c0_seq1:292-1869(+)
MFYAYSHNMQNSGQLVRNLFASDATEDGGSPMADSSDVFTLNTLDVDADDAAYLTPPGSPTHPGNTSAQLLSVARPQSGAAGFIPPSPCISRQKSYLMLDEAPQPPRALLKRDAHTMFGRPSPAAAAAHRPRPPNVNPFTPDTRRELLEPSPSKRLRGTSAPDPSLTAAMRRRCSIVNNAGDQGHHRLDADFELVRALGDGAFGTVSLYRHRLDGILYAIKRTKEPIHGLQHEQRLLREVYAHAVLEEQPHIVRYHSAWVEDGHMLIQNEFCDGGSLEDEIRRRTDAREPFSEQELCRMLLHVGRGLASLHAQDLVHMDIKPGNIFVKTTAATPIYKIGDLGHVTKVSSPSVDDEGDSRYLAREILQQNFTDIVKGDIFALGLSILQAALLVDLPKNGPEWHKLRDGVIPPCPAYSAHFNNLLEHLLKPKAADRFSAKELLEYPLLLDSTATEGTPRNARELEKLLQAERMLSDKLIKALKGRTPESSGGGAAVGLGGAGGAAGSGPREPSRLRAEFKRNNSVAW